MDKKLRHLIHQLKGKTYPDSMRYEFYPYGDKAFEILLKGVSAGEFTDVQARNAFHIMLDMTKQACQDRKKDLFDLAIKYCMHKSMEIRSAAVHVAIGLARLFESYPELYQIGIDSKDEILPDIKKALELELDPKTSEYAEWFIGK